ncbi:TfuA-related McrA-glycine thioamidation protein [Methanoregula sp.]|jgi:TfuA protein|uniref:TfuA-related McrA-glycine thioamidation protein n=1 Tax=Methanoregula sp. TaxID=2052170 RepID=UPI003C1748EF
MQKIIVFLGPSLDIESATDILPAEYRPPAKRGDLLRAVDDGATVIGLIDGVFHQESAVAHREILAAIRRGVRVVGSSSMGALRAAEMDTLGMVGIGDVYRMYKSGVLESDDEVALVFDPVSGYSLSEPLVNIRYTLRKARDSGVISGVEHDALLAAARSVFYPQRTYARITAAAGETVGDITKERFLAWAGTNACDRKRQDAIEALEYIASLDPE